MNSLVADSTSTPDSILPARVAVSYMAPDTPAARMDVARFVRPGDLTTDHLGGDITVTDAQPLPTSEEQCKHGGWAQFGFDNRKQCVRSVRQRARQECIFIRAAVGRPAFRAQYGSGVHKRHAMRRCIRERIND